METLLELKDRLKSFYSKYEIYMMPVLKFVLAFVLFFVINKNIGFMERLDSLPVILILALLCSILSPNMMVLFAVVLTLLHLYALSKEVFLTGAVLFLILALLYFRFAPEGRLSCGDDTDLLRFPHPVCDAADRGTAVSARTQCFRWCAERLFIIF